MSIRARVSLERKVASVTSPIQSGHCLLGLWVLLSMFRILQFIITICSTVTLIISHFISGKLWGGKILVVWPILFKLLKCGWILVFIVVRVSVLVLLPWSSRLRLISKLISFSIERALASMWWNEVWISIIWAWVLKMLVWLMGSIASIDVSTALVLSLSVMPSVRILKYSILLLKLLAFHGSTSTKLSRLHH